MPSEIVLSDFTQQATQTIEHGVEHFIAQMAMRIRDVAKDNLHVGYGVDTGAMQESISAITSEGSDYAEHVGAASGMNPEADFAPEVALEDDYSAAVQVPVHYAAFVELGTSRGPAQPFLTPAVELVAAQADNIAREVFDVQ